MNSTLCVLLVGSRPDSSGSFGRWSKRLLFMTLLLGVSVGVSGQTAGWVKEEKADPLRDTKYLVFTLDGKFLTPPQNAKPGATPSLILQCSPGSYTRGHQHGKLLKGY